MAISLCLRKIPGKSPKKDNEDGQLQNKKSPENGRMSGGGPIFQAISGKGLPL
jgi:hypothetical protein